MIDFNTVNKSFGGQDILKNVSFRINTNERVGLVGPNGAGKSTIFGIISGAMLPDKGDISIPGGMRIGYLHQHIDAGKSGKELLQFTADAIPELSNISQQLQEIEHELSEGAVDSARQTKLLDRQGRLQSEFEHLGGYRIRSDAATALSGLGFHVDDFTRPISSFSGGWQMRAALARTLIANPDILLLDEPSNYLDIPAIEWLDRFLRAFRGTLMLISHDRYLLNTLVGITIEINNGIVTRYSGNYDYYLRERDNRFKTLYAAQGNQQKRRDQLERSIARFRSKSTKASQVQSWIKELDKMPIIDLPEKLNYSGSLRLPPPPKCGNEIIRLEQIKFAYDEQNFILDGIDLEVQRGDKIAIVGYNGTGKTTLLKVIAEQLKLNTGKRVLGHNVVLGYQAQEFADILPDGQSAFDVVRAALPAGASINSVQSILGGFGFSGDDADKTCKVLSGGEKIRLCFARIFVNPPNLLILDEPTTHLDIAAREGLQKALNDYQGTLCLVSHDIEFVRQVATSIIAMESPGIKKYFGNYEYYREKSRNAYGEAGAELGEPVTDESNNLSSKERRQERARRRSLLQKEKRKADQLVAKLENELETLEAENSTLLEQLSANKPETDFAKVTRQLADIQKSITDITDRWEEAAEIAEELAEQNRAIHNDG
ncbi:MAG: ABC-F family ATP-binding cassette domain-containing protein [Victivallaceae bacterium]|nr:ABC-F family ATP-binding cassette domain-containing protein [Victivallaceae bacterium]